MNDPKKLMLMQQQETFAGFDYYNLTSGVPPYPTGAVFFDGVNDYLERDGALTGLANSNKFFLSMWINFAGSNGIWSSQFCDYSAAYCYVARSPSNTFQCHLRGVLGGDLYFETAGTVTSLSGWTHIAVSVDTTGVTQLQFYINGVSSLGVILLNTLAAGENINFAAATTNWYVGAGYAGFNRHNGDMADMFVKMGGTFVDLSDSSVLGKFISPAGKPVYLGANGEVPFGSPPIVYLRQPYTDSNPNTFATNLGTGGGFFIVGGNDISLTSPSD